MKKAICGTFFPRTWDYEKKFAATKSVGFDGIELNFGVRNSDFTPETTDEQYAAVVAAAKKAGLELGTLTTILWSYPITSNFPEKRAEAVELIKGSLYAASKIGAKSVLIVPGYCGVDFLSNPEKINYLDAYNRAVTALNECKVVAEELKVNLSIENVWNKFLTSPLEMRQIIDMVNSQYVGSYFDVGNVLVNGYPEHWIEILGSRIKAVHFKDFDRNIGNVEGFVDLLKGHVDFTAVMEAFKKIGYDGWVTAEYGCLETEDDKIIAYLKSIADAMDDILRRV